MEKLIAQFPKHISDGLYLSENHDFSHLAEEKFNHIVICGMGGSGISGKVVANWFLKDAKIPFYLLQNYDLPGFINQSTLFIASSYSGNTEETLAATKLAAQKGAKIIGVSSGGELLKFCKNNGYEFIKVPGGNPPRSMMAFSIIQLTKILCDANIVKKEALKNIELSRTFLNRHLIDIKNKAKEVASLALNKNLVIYADPTNEAIAIRFRQQVNENAKQLCWHHIIPEMNHNELVGWAGGNDNHAALFISSQFMNERNTKRFELNQNIISNRTAHVLAINPIGGNLIEESFYLIHLLDWASFYLSELNKVDPVEVNVIDYLKSQLIK